MQNKPLTKDVMLDTLDKAAIEQQFKEGLEQAINAAGALVQLKDGGNPNMFAVAGLIFMNLPQGIQSAYERVETKPTDCGKSTNAL